jgi:F0F1-type ATP synthase membrane subunit b/b'
LIQIQELNSQLNQAKQTASALMDAADKSASSIINHIS